MGDYRLFDYILILVISVIGLFLYFPSQNRDSIAILNVVLSLSLGYSIGSIISILQEKHKNNY